MLLALVIFSAVNVSSSFATELTKPTLDAFLHYVHLAEERMQNELSEPDKFLYSDTLPEEQRRALMEELAKGLVIVRKLEARENGNKISVPGGLVHHWIAIVYMPGVRLSDALALQQDYDHEWEIYKPDIQQSRLLSRDGEKFKVYMRLYRKAIVTAVYNAEFEIEYFPVSESREYSLSHSTRIAELENPSRPNEREKPVGNDRGYLWRLNTYTRYEERDGGLYMQIEFIALSRSVPAIFAWLVNPYVKSIPREYLSSLLTVTRNKLLMPKAPSTAPAETVHGYGGRVASFFAGPSTTHTPIVAPRSMRAIP
jgi:hypothetical protein